MRVTLKNRKFSKARSLHDIAWLFSGSGATQVLGLISMVFMARVFKPTELGEFFFLQSWLTVFSGWGLPGLSTSVVSSVARGEGGTYRRAVFLESISALGGSICIFCIGLWFSDSQKFLGLWAYIFASFLFPFSINDCGLQALAGQRKYHYISIIQVFTRTINLLWLFICALCHIGIGLFFILQLLTTCIINFILIVVNWRSMRAMGNYNPESIRYGIHLTISNVLQQPMSQAEKLLVGFFFGSANLAVFGLGEMVYNNLRILANLSQSFYYPRLVQLKNHTVFSYLCKRSIIWTVLFIFLAVCFLIFFPLIYPIVLGQQYYESAKFAIYYSFAFSVGVPNFFIAIYLRHMRSSKVTYIYGLIRMPISICCLAALFYYFGILGLPFARGITNILYAISGFLLIKKISETSLQRNPSE